MTPDTNTPLRFQRDPMHGPAALLGAGLLAQAVDAAPRQDGAVAAKSALIQAVVALRLATTWNP